MKEYEFLLICDVPIQKRGLFLHDKRKWHSISIESHLGEWKKYFYIVGCQRVVRLMWQVRGSVGIQWKFTGLQVPSAEVEGEVSLGITLIK